MAPCVLYLHSSNNIHQVSGLTSNDPVDLNATMNVNYIIDSWGARAAVFLLKRLDPCRSRLQSCLPWILETVVVVLLCYKMAASTSQATPIC
jgi:hypothetical protein